MYQMRLSEHATNERFGNTNVLLFRQIVISQPLFHRRYAKGRLLTILGIIERF